MNFLTKFYLLRFQGLVKPAICNETGEEEPERAPIGITFENDPMNFPAENSSKTSTSASSGHSESTGKTTPCHVFSSSHHHGDATTAGSQSETTAAETTSGHVTHDKSHDTTTAAHHTDGSTTAHHTDGSTASQHADGATEAVHQSTLPCRVTVITEDSSGATHAMCASSQKVVEATVPPEDDSTTHHPPHS